MSLLTKARLSELTVDSDPLGLNDLSPGLYPEDVGKKWKDLGIIASGIIQAMTYCGNGIALIGDNDFHVYRSTDYGATWADLGVIASNFILSMTYCGNGIALLGDADFHVYRSTDYGATWADLGVIATDDIRAMVYCGNGIVLISDFDRHVWRSDCAFKTDECASESSISQATPDSAGAAGHKGEIRWDDSFIYVCIADNTWKRVAIASW